MAGAVSRWLGSVEGLSEIVQRLLRVQIEQGPAVEVIKRYDSAETLFYCDPPYPHDSRSDVNAYGFEMTDRDHRELADVLHNVQGKVAISSYHCRLMDELYGDWAYIESPPKKAHSTNTRSDNKKRDRVEVLWVNYEIPNRHMFDLSQSDFLDEYPALILAEPENSTSQPIKEVFLSMCQAAEAG